VPPDFKFQIADDGTPIIFNPKTGEARIASGFAQGQFPKPQSSNTQLTPYQQFQATSEIQKNIQRFTQGQREVQRQYSTMKEAFDRLDKGEAKDLNATTQAIITSFNKILDPSSVVRESEYARSPEGQSLLDNLAGRILKLQQGGAGLTKDSLREFVTLAKIYSDNATASLNQTVQQQIQTAESFGLNTSLFGNNTQQSEPQIQLTPLVGPINPLAPALIRKYPYQEVAEFIKQYPDATEAEIRELVGGSEGTNPK